MSAPAGQAMAFDPEKHFSENEEPRTILRFGFTALKNGNLKEAIGAFRFGAAKNDLASQWKLARMLQSGSGMKKDDLAAYKLFAKIANRFNDRFPRRADRPYVSSAHVALGEYALRGINGTNVRVNPRQAEAHFYHAAALYKDREAQYRLGVLYRNGTLGSKQPRTALRWFGLSARKGHHRAQAALGEMLFYGEGTKRNPVRGLVFMSKAMSDSAKSGVQSIREMRKEAFAKASDAQRKAANRIIGGLNLDANESVRASNTSNSTNIFSRVLERVRSGDSERSEERGLGFQEIQSNGRNRGKRDD